MKKNFNIRPVIGILCILALIAVVALAVFLDSRSPNPILGVFQTEPTEESASAQTTAPTQSAQNGTEETTQAPTQPDSETKPTEGEKEPEQPEQQEQIVPPPEDLPPVVTLPTEKDPQTGEPAGIAFPCQIPGYDLLIEKMAPYNGMFVEDGSNVNASQVAMLLVSNQGDNPVEYTSICVNYGQEQLIFDITALPVGERMVVQEKTGKKMPQEKALEATALVVQRANLDMSEDQIQVTDNGDNTLTVRNLTDQMIPSVRVFYKYYMEDEDVFVGGIAFTVRITRLTANGSVVIQPSHYNSQTSRVVMVLTYDE